MENLIINGPSKLQGKVKISGSKNEALKLIPLAINLRGSIIIENVPKIKDIFSQLEIFKVLGGKVDFQDNLVLDGNSVNKFTTVGEHSKSLRASIVYLGPLLSKFKKAEIPFPGGCAIGLRPIDTHLDAFKDLGASIKKSDETVWVSLDNIKNNRIKLKEQSVSATENVILYLSSVRNDVTIENCAIEPEIMHLVEILKSGGADIVSPANRVFRVKGTDKLNIKRIKVMPDRIEAGTFLIAIAATGGSGEIYPFQKQYLKTPLKILKECGVRFRCTEDKCIVYNSPDLSSFEITTSPYPGFPTDLQSPMALIAAKAKGTSVINETMFENRLNYLNNIVLFLENPIVEEFDGQTKIPFEELSDTSNLLISDRELFVSDNFLTRFESRIQDASWYPNDRFIGITTNNRFRILDIDTLNEFSLFDKKSDTPVIFINSGKNVIFESEGNIFSAQIR